MLDLAGAGHLARAPVADLEAHRASIRREVEARGWHPALGSYISRLGGQDVDAGRKVFESRCARCHGADGNGGEMGPPITFRLIARDDQQLAALINEGLPARGMPPSAVSTMRFTSAAVIRESPDNLDLENGDNWERVWENKNVRIVAIEHN